jgi:5-methylcytosine-specific restriction endonuclease McrA
MSVGVRDAGAASGIARVSKSKEVKMGKRQKIWARAKRDQMMNLYGGECAHCGATENLTLDALNPTKRRAHHRMDSSARMSWYSAQHRKNNLQILCRSCNSRKNDKPAK